MRRYVVLPLLIAGLARGVFGEEIAVARVEALRTAPVSPAEAAASGPDLPDEVGPDLGAALQQLPPGVRSAGAGDPEAPAVEYTVDPALDAEVREILARGGVRFGQVVLMDPASGELFAYVTTDAEAFPATRAYPTASLMKLVTAAAVLRDAPAAATRVCRFRGSPYAVGLEQLAPPRAGGGLASFEDAIAISNNQCFARLAVRDLGSAALAQEIERVGMLAEPAPGHPAGRVDPIEDDLALGRLGSGLAGSYLSPLAAARLAGALANGELVTPRWIARVRDSQGVLVAAPAPAEPIRIWTPEIAATLRGALRSVIERGTASRAFRDDAGQPLLGPVAVSGKTGTLRGEDPEGLYQWFIGVAPAEQPRVAIAVLVVHGEGDVAASASQVAATALQMLFCDGAGCDGVRLERLHASARARDAASAAELEAQRARALAAAQAIRPARLLERAEIELPRRLRRHKVDGEIVLRVSVAPTGAVADVEVASSDLPRFEKFVSEQVRGWSFSPTLRGGEPIYGTVEMHIPIRVE